MRPKLSCGPRQSPDQAAIKTSITPWRSVGSVPRVPMAELQNLHGVEVLTMPELTSLGVDAVVTTRHGGVSRAPYDTLNLGLHVGDDDAAVIENRARAMATIESTLDDLVVMDQVHGARVCIVDDADRGRGSRNLTHAISATDALVTRTVDLPLLVLVADCAPIVLCDPEARVLSVVHAGWRGTVAGAPHAALEAMCSLGAKPEHVIAVIGPTIRASRYEVGDEVTSALTTAGLGGAIERSLPRSHVNLVSANTIALSAAGLDPGHIYATTFASDDAMFFSDRAARPCGRFGILAKLNR